MEEGAEDPELAWDVLPVLPDEDPGALPALSDDGLPPLGAPPADDELDDGEMDDIFGEDMLPPDDIEQGLPPPTPEHEGFDEEAYFEGEEGYHEDEEVLEGQFASLCRPASFTPEHPCMMIHRPAHLSYLSSTSASARIVPYGTAARAPKRRHLVGGTLTPF